MGLVDSSNPPETDPISRSYFIGASVMTAAFAVSIVSAVASLIIYAVLMGFYIVEGPEARARRRDRISG
jgi:hypothetical protein